MHRLGRWFLGCLAAILLGGPVHAATVKQIVSRYANSAVQDGSTVGIGVAVVRHGAKPEFFGYGAAVAATDTTPAKPFTPGRLFEIGSVTKVFTTNLLGQAVARGELDLDTQLRDFRARTGKLRSKMRRVTLRELGDFTGGITDYAPLCSTPNPPPGCLPSPRPTIATYDAEDFARYFRHAEPMNYQANPPSGTGLPAPYFYSDYGIGYLGLLLAKDSGKLTNKSLASWYGQVRKRILRPLGMGDTFLNVPTAKAGRLAGGYNTALAHATVANGSITAIAVESRGGGYAAAPTVEIVGGGGSGATATATLSGKQVGTIDVTAGGTGYIAPPKIVFANGGSSTEATAHAIVRNGRLVAVAVTSGGAGYQQPPDVIISGGRTANGSDATALAHIANGRISNVEIEDPGSGYVPPLSVVISPGAPIENVVPIWAPAGALTTSLRDMAKFATAAMRTHAGGKLDPLTEGFRIAERPHACTGPKPSLYTCPAQSNMSGLAWAVQPIDLQNLVPTVVSKDGGLDGFSTFVALMPSQKLGVVVFANARQTLLDPPDTPTAIAAKVANNILYALYYDSRSRKARSR